MDFSYLLHTHAAQEFPYTANQLACALLLLGRHADPLCDHMKQIDDLVVPDFTDPNCMETRDGWYQDAEARQEWAFEEALDKLALEFPEEAQSPIGQVTSTFGEAQSGSDDEEAKQ